MLLSDQKELLSEKVYQLLDSEGMKIESDQIVSAMLRAGCQQSPSGRVRIPRELIEQMAAYQKQTQAQDSEDQELHYRCGVDWAHHIIWHNKQEEMRRRLESELLVSAFDCGPTIYFDYTKNKAVPVNTDILIEMCKFAQATAEIGYMSTWYRQGVPPKIERIESLVMGLKYTNKLDGIEAIYPEVIKYLKQASEIITDKPGDSSYLAGSECITSPLILERRSAEDIIERKKAGVHRYHVASMPTIGIASPVTIAGSVVLTAAELLGGMAACFVLDPESDLSGRAIALVVDMKNASNTATGPEVAITNRAVAELFDAFWGGHCWVEVFFSPFAQRPGLQAVCENLIGGWRYSKLLGRSEIIYPGMGTLANGGVGSPVQFMLDLEIRKSQVATKDRISTADDQVAFDELCQATREGADFLSTDHTLDHFRELHSSSLFLTDKLSPTWPGDEKAVLDKCEEMWRANLENYEPPVWPDDKTKALENLLAEAKKKFSICYQRLIN